MSRDAGAADRGGRAADGPGRSNAPDAPGRRTVRVLCTPEVAPGFALIGIAPAVASPGPEGAARLERLREDPAAGVVLVEETIHRALPEELREGLRRRPVPMVVPFPGPTWAVPPAPEAYIVELLRRAIGYRVRLR